ncbi:MAG: cation-efflux pump [Alphaproteobacteria bacterium]|nr:cation-efflux pump [Alphaproteobacteria bacterium]
MPHSKEKQSVALSSILASAVMTIGKFAVGISTGSLGIISEGAHSLLDLGATIMTYMAVRVSDKPADEEHPYGHGKIESIAALAETALLFITCIWILYEAGHRLLARKFDAEVTWWSMAVIVVSILIDISRARALSRVAKKTKSQALEADALHFSSDVLSSAVVLVGLWMVALGWPIGDPLAAMGVAIFVCRAGWNMARRTIDTLIDAAPEGTTEKIKTIVAGVKGVVMVNRIRVRPAGSVLFVEADIAVSRALPLHRFSVTKRHIIEAISASMPEAEVTVSVHPLALDTETIHQRIGIIAGALALSVHHITVHQVDGHLSVGLDLEQDGRKTMDEAYEAVAQLEAAIRDELGDSVEVDTHLDPLQTRESNGEEVTSERLNEIRMLVEARAMTISLIRDVHAVRVRQTVQGLAVFFHCRVDPQRTVEEVHKAMDDMEYKVRESLPDVWRVVGRAEPVGREK